MALLKNYHPFEGPNGLTLMDLFKKFDKTWALTKKSTTKYGRTSPERTYEDAMKRRKTDPWNFLFIAGMWFQDLFNYDFRRTEMCIIPYATQQGEISFCAYNTGIGWRQIIENMHKNATVAEWYKTHGKHEIYAKGKNVNLQSYEHSLRIDAEDAARVRHLEHDIPLTAAEEERARRKRAYEEQAKVRAIYEELVLKKPQPAVVQIGTLGDIAKAVPANFANAGEPVNIAPTNGNGHSNGNGVANKEQAAEAVAGD
jgi:7,8-dihydro-6-hydroxymethylpterin dimethyltransferase